MVMTDAGCGVAIESQPPGDQDAVFFVALHEAPLVGRQARRLGEKGLRDHALANVMQQACDSRYFEVFSWQLHHLANVMGHLADTLAVVGQVLPLNRTEVVPRTPQQVPAAPFDVALSAVGESAQMADQKAGQGGGGRASRPWAF